MGIGRQLKRRFSMALCMVALACTPLVVAPVAAKASTESIWMYNSQHVLVDMSAYYFDAQGHVFSISTGQSVGSVSEPSGNILDSNNNVIGEVVIAS